MNHKSTVYFFVTLVALVLLGFLGYYFGFLGSVYNLIMPGVFGKFPLVVVSVILGVAAFFSPCSFTVLPAYVSHFLSANTEGRNLARGISLGLIAAAGVITTNIIIGLIIAFLGRAAPFASDPRQDIPLILGIRAVAGLVIAYLGILTLLEKQFTIPIIANWIGQVDFKKSIFLYGVLYNGAAIGCTGPILLGLMLYALTTGSFGAALTAFVVFALTMGVLMVLLTTATATLGRTAVQKFRPATRGVQKLAGLVMVLVGLSIALLTLEGNRLFVKLFFPFLK